MTLYWYDSLTERLRAAGDWLAPLGLRLILFWEFWSAGTTKLHGANWFERVQDNFPFPFGSLPVELNWLLSTWTEILASLAILLGLFTRFFAFSLIILTAVAIVAVHWPAEWAGLAELWKGYSVSRVVEDDVFRGNFRLPLIFLVMLLPLVFMGGGKFSVDHLLVTLTQRGSLIHERASDFAAAGLAALIFGLTLVYLIPTAGIALLVAAAILLIYPLVR